MLPAGTSLGPYKILAPLGAGGMGEVYRAHDSRLGRDVAIKVLSSHLAATPDVGAPLESAARPPNPHFEREARTISQLNHPHICTLHDVGHQEDVDYLVMELLEGETLAHRLEKGPLPLAELLALGVQVADALDVAHRRGIVHRDLKPANVMLTKSGAKLMDFGLARAASAPDGRGLTVVPGDLSESPTVSRPLTREGALVGTFQYMAPEQLEGTEADARTDIWALGCVLYEMATGKRAFEGTSQASLIAAILEHEPRPITELRPIVPPSLDRVVRRCLEKNPEDRLQSARDLAFDLAGISESAAGASVPAPGSARPAARRSWSGAVAGFLAGAVVVAAVVLVLPRLHHAPSPAAVRFNFAPPQGWHTFSGRGWIGAAISPDGRAGAFVAADSSGIGCLWVRRLDEMAPRMIPGTENAGSPIWSPDGRHLAFTVEGKLRRIGIDGGDIETVCAAPDMRGAAWSQDGTIVFAPSSDGPLFKVPATGGTPEAVTVLDSTRFETAHRFPTFLPDGRHFVFVALPPRLGRYTILVGSVDGMKPKKVLEADGGAIYAAPGWLIYARSTRLMAQRFDVRALKVKGEPLALGDSPDRGNIWGCSGVSASRSGNGVLAYVPWTPPNNEMAWYGLDGRPLGKVPVAPGPYRYVVPSPDGLQFLAERQVAQDRTEIWRLDGVRGLATRLADLPGSSEGALWSPDGRSAMYQAERSGPPAFYMMDASGVGAEKLVYQPPSAVTNLVAWPASHDGVLIQQMDPATGGDLWWLPLHGDQKPVPIVQTRAVEGDVADLSPDGKWLLYNSDVTGRDELYARPFAGGREVQVTTTGSSWGCWRKNGREILSQNAADRCVTAIPFEPGSPPHVGAPRTLFTVPEGTYSLRYDASGDRFLITRSIGRPEDSSMTVLLNWTAALKKL
jgi:Tol biopolymer transport system component